MDAGGETGKRRAGHSERYGVNGALMKCHSRVPTGIYAGNEAREICRFESGPAHNAL
jgi:hypothetical protein